MSLARQCWVFACALLCWTGQVCLAADVVIKVVPGSGTKVILKALKQAREVRANWPSGQSGAIRIVFPAGEYPVLDPVVLTPDDAGTEQVPTVLEAEEPGKAVWVGAVRLTDPSPQGQPAGAWRYSLAGIKHRVDERDGGQFFVGDQRAVLARMPNVGMEWAVQGAGAEGDKSRFVSTAEQINWLSKAWPDQEDRAMLHVMQSWTSNRHRIADVQASRSVVRIKPAANWPFMQFGAVQRFVVQNVPAALDAPGEWLQFNQSVVYVPRSINERGLPAYLPVNEHLLQFEGDGDRGKWVEYIDIKGLSFAYARHPLMGDVAQGDWQGAVNVGAAVELSGARHVRFTDCRIEHTGGYALWLRDAVQHVDVSRCVFQDLGAGGVKVGMPQEPRSGRVMTGFNRVLDSVVNRTGQDFPGAVGIWVGHSFGNVIQGNVVANTTYTGISVGWQWGYGKATSGDNQVRGNVLWNIGQGQLADLAAIYTLGRSPGSVISGNFIRRVRGFRQYGAGAWGIYSDEGSSDMTISGNVVVDAESGAFHLHYGRSLRVQGNVFVLGGGPEINWTDVRQSGDWRLENNVLMSQDDKVYKVLGDASGMHASGNQSGALRVSGLATDVAAMEVEGMSADRQIVFRNVLQAAQKRVQGVRALRSVDAFPLPGAPALAMSKQENRAPSVILDFASQLAGAHPPPLRYSPASQLQLIQVGPGEPSSGRAGNCLRFVDGKEGLASFDPHVYLDYVTSSGAITAEFDVWVDNKTSLVHEWRDGAEPFKTGPSLTVRADGVVVGGRVLFAWQPGAWYRIKVVSKLAVEAEPKWDLYVTAAGKTTAWRNLPVVSPAWRRLAWMGWVSSTDKEARTCLASLKVTND